ncbi:MAG: phosphoribosyltransferase family protein, partial [Patescibacteria group bacterium]
MRPGIYAINKGKRCFFKGRVLGHELLSGRQVNVLIRRLAKAIYKDYVEKPAPLLFIHVTNGGTWLYSRLREELAELGFPLERALDESLSSSAYGQGTELKRVKVETKFPQGSLRGLHVVLVEDIIDSGGTITAVIRQILLADPLTVEVCALLKRHTSEGITPKYLAALVEFKDWLLGG